MHVCVCVCVWKAEVAHGLWLWQCLSVDRLTPSPRGHMKNWELRHYETGEQAWKNTESGNTACLLSINYTHICGRHSTQNPFMQTKHLQFAFSV